MCIKTIRPSQRVQCMVFFLERRDSMDDKRWMQHAIDLARNGRGMTSPNPLVGAVLVDDDGNVVGEGWHHKG